MPIVTIHDYSRPSRMTRFTSRQCPNLSTCWPGLSQSFNPCVTDRPLMLRRTAFLIILILRELHSVLLSLEHIHNSILFIPSFALTVLFFLFVAWNLHLIVEMQGERKVFGFTFGRRWFDGFLWTMVAGHAAILLRDWGHGYRGVGASAAWVSFFLMIFAVAWIATWEPEDGEEGVRLPY